MLYVKSEVLTRFVVCMGREVDVLVFGGVALCGLFGGPEGGGSMPLCKWYPFTRLRGVLNRNAVI